MNQVVSFIDVYLAISAGSLVALLLAAIGIIATWPRSGRFFARLWRRAAHNLPRKHNR